MKEKYLSAWKNNLSPSAECPYEFDAYMNVKFCFEEFTVSLQGSIRWDENCEAYFFEPVRQVGTNIFEPIEYPVPVNFYLLIRAELRDKLGIHITRGIEVRENSSRDSSVVSTLN